MKKFMIVMFALIAMTGILYAAGALTSGDQLIRGSKTFEHDATFNQNVTVRNALLGMNQYGSIYFVHSGSGVDSRSHGKTYLKPYASIEYAINGAAADVGDIIYVMPGHSVAITAAAEIDIDVAGVQLIGLGRGSNKPTVTYGADGSVVIGADNVTIKNFRFSPDDDDVVVGVDIDDGIDNARIIDCEFGFPVEATDEFLIAVQTNDASNYAEIRGCRFHAGAQGAASAIAFTKDTHGTIVDGNWITGTYSTSPFTGTTTASTMLMISNNVMQNATGDAYNLVAASTGTVIGNYHINTSTTAAADMDIGNALNIRNWHIADDDVGGAKGAMSGATSATITATADGGA